jgi:hypothetical protein
MEAPEGESCWGWHTDVMEASNLELSHFWLSMTIRPTWMTVPFLLTVFYGPSDDVDKPEFLSELLSIMPSNSVQWIVLGDFNLIYEARDKNNLNLNWQLMGRFRRTLDRCELSEFALQNHRYIWSN